MDELHLAGVVLDDLHGVAAAAVHPVHVQLKAQLSGVFADDVQHGLAAELDEFHMVVVVIQLDAFVRQLLGSHVGHAAEVQHLVKVGHAVHGQHADADEVAVEILAVLDDLGEMGGEGFLTGHAGRSHACGGGGNLHAALFLRALHLRHVVGSHGQLGDFHRAVAQLADLLEGFIYADFGKGLLEHGGLHAYFDLFHNAIFLR